MLNVVIIKLASLIKDKSYNNLILSNIKRKFIKQIFQKEVLLLDKIIEVKVLVKMRVLRLSIKIDYKI